MVILHILYDGMLVLARATPGDLNDTAPKYLSIYLCHGEHELNHLLQLYTVYCFELFYAKKSRRKRAKLSKIYIQSVSMISILNLS